MKEREVWLIEDNEGDILLVSEAFEQSPVSARLTVIKTGNSAIDQLYLRLKEHSTHSPPDLIFLDINLPKMNGIEVLGLIKSHAGLQSIPVIILTTSSSPLDMERAYGNNANCFVTKAFDASEFIHTIQRILAFWLGGTVAKPSIC